MLQELICLRAIRDVNVPKFLQEDLKLFSGIVSDLFPTIRDEDTDYGILDKAIRRACEKDNLKDVDGEPLAPGCLRKRWLQSPWNPKQGNRDRQSASGSLTPDQVCCGLGLSVKQSMGRAGPLALALLDLSGDNYLEKNASLSHYTSDTTCVGFSHTNQF